VGGWRLAACAAAFWLGILSAPTVVPAGGPAAVLLLLAGVGVPVVFLLAVPRRGSGVEAPRWLVGMVLAVAFLLLGTGWGGLRRQHVLDSPLAALHGRRVDVSGSLSDEPEERDVGWTAELHVDMVADPDRAPGVAIRLSEPLWLEGKGRPSDLHRGDRVVVEGLLRAPRGDFGEHLVDLGFPATMLVQEIRRVGGPTSPLARAAVALRSALRSSLERTLPAGESGLVMGLVLGDTSKLDEGVEEDFRATGLSHLTAVSGENLAMFIAPVLGLLTMLGLGRWWRFGIGLGAVGFFIVLTGGEPSVLRAAAMAGLTLLGVFLGRPRSPPAIMGGSILALLGLDPSLVYSIGFQLSVGATVGMAFLSAPLAARIPRVPEGLALAIGTTLGAQIGVSPLILFYFGVVPLVTLPANILAFPAVGPGMLLGLAAGALGLVFVPLGGAVGVLAGLPLRYLEGLADHLARSPLPSVTSPTGRLPVLVGGVAVGAALGWWLQSGQRLSRRAMFGVGLVLPLFVWSTALRAGPPPALTVVFFDVGQGDGALVRSPGGATLLVDGGPDPDLVALKLASLGVRRIDVMIGTHPHADHVVGLPSVLSRFVVGLILDPGCPSDAPYYQDYLRAVAAAHVPMQQTHPGSVVTVADMRLEIIGPEQCFKGTNSDPNNDSIVFRLQVGQTSILFPGDAEEPNQTDLLRDYAGSLSAVVLKVPHHGGDTNLGEFLQSIHAAVAVVSVGQPNRYGHPVQSVLDELAADGMRVYRTDLDGDVTVTFRGTEVLVDTG
jgi:competence protein ComEC